MPDVPTQVTDLDPVALVAEIGARARTAATTLATAPSQAKIDALRTAGYKLRNATAELLEANAKDMAFGREKNLSEAMLDRLELTPTRIESMASGLDQIAGMTDPVGEVIAEWERPNGLKISRVRVPLGVIGIIYESRPNVTADAGSLALMAGNAAILRGGSESLHSSAMIVECLREGLAAAGLPEDAVQLIPTRDRAAVGALLTATEHIDLIVPRGGKGLIARVQEESRVPVLAHLDGICHVYLHESADAEKAVAITVNAKMRRTGICGSAETLLIDRRAEDRLAPGVIAALLDAGCEVRGDAALCALDSRVIPATKEDWGTEYLAPIISAKIVDGVDSATRHIAAYGSHHTEAIIAEDAGAVETFFNDVDSAIVLHNASTQYADGGEFGMGAEIGISTGKLHARGPVGAAELTSYKYLVRGDGQTRP